MPTYIMLSTLTENGAETLKEQPDRLKEVNREVEAMGVKVLQQYAVLGPYDFVNIVEAPDNDTVARVSVELGARGSVRIVTLPAIPIDAFVSRLKKQ
ncbi:MAG: GYD domain-containing protein [bacterium]